MRIRKHDWGQGKEQTHVSTTVAKFTLFVEVNTEGLRGNIQMKLRKMTGYNTKIEQGI